jgi:hypothetical protein
MMGQMLVQMQGAVLATGRVVALLPAQQAPAEQVGPARPAGVLAGAVVSAAVVAAVAVEALAPVEPRWDVWALSPLW